MFITTFLDERKRKANKDKDLRSNSELQSATLRYSEKRCETENDVERVCIRVCSVKTSARWRIIQYQHIGQ